MSGKIPPTAAQVTKGILNFTHVQSYKDVVQIVKDDPGIRLMFLPKGSPQLNGTEEI